MVWLHFPSITLLSSNASQSHSFCPCTLSCCGAYVFPSPPFLFCAPALFFLICRYSDTACLPHRIILSIQRVCLRPTRAGVHIEHPRMRITICRGYSISPCTFERHETNSYLSGMTEIGYYSRMCAVCRIGQGKQDILLSFLQKSC